jgi:hypothetical protein
MLLRCGACAKAPMIFYGRELLHCRSCGHLQIAIPIGAKKYNEDYCHKYDCYEKTVLGKRINDVRWGLVESHLLEGSTRVLDWGCGNGSFIRSAPDGWYVRGYDINPHSGYSDNAELATEPWEAVTMWDVLEHMVYPYEFINELKTNFLFLVVPDTAGIRGTIYDWKHYRTDEHQHYFSLASLTIMLERAGFYVAGVERTEALLRDYRSPDSLVTVVGRKK